MRTTTMCWLLLGCALLPGCGNKGPLVHASAPAEEAVAVDAETDVVEPASAVNGEAAVPAVETDPSVAPEATTTDPVPETAPTEPADPPVPSDPVSPPALPEDDGTP